MNILYILKYTNHYLNIFIRIYGLGYILKTYYRTHRNTQFRGVYEYSYFSAVVKMKMKMKGSNLTAQHNSAKVPVR